MLNRLLCCCTLFAPKTLALASLARRSLHKSLVPGIKFMFAHPPLPSIIYKIHLYGIGPIGSNKYFTQAFSYIFWFGVQNLCRFHMSFPPFVLFVLLMRSGSTPSMQNEARHPHVIADSDILPWWVCCVREHVCACSVAIGGAALKYGRQTIDTFYRFYWVVAFITYRTEHLLPEDECLLLLSGFSTYRTCTRDAGAPRLFPLMHLSCCGS